MTVAELTREARPRSDDVLAAPSAWYDPDSATYGDAEPHAAPEPPRRENRVISVAAPSGHDAMHGEWG